MSVYAEQWVEDLPRSQMEYPDTFFEKVLYWFWRLYTPFHPYLRDFATAIGVIRHSGRQDFLLGVLPAHHSPRELAEHLVRNGFGNHFVAWKDSGELVSLRKTEGFRYQYHVRVFADGEVRGHYEYTPEYRPVQHILQTGFEERGNEFKQLLQDWIVPPSFSKQI